MLVGWIHWVSVLLEGADISTEALILGGTVPLLSLIGVNFWAHRFVLYLHYRTVLISFTE